MKNLIVTPLFFVLIVLIFNSCKNTNSESDTLTISEHNDETKDMSESESEPKTMEKYFSDWHYPYGHMLPAEKMAEIWRDIDAMPVEDKNSIDTNSWTCIGPHFMKIQGDSAIYTGRILDIEADDNSPFRIASASGGLWQREGSTNKCISDNLTSLVIGSFDTKPGDSNSIIAGTGEYNKRSGTGVFLTTDKGVSWRHLTLTPEPISVFKVRYEPGNINNVHLAANTGYYKSTDGGSNWIRHISSGSVTDFEFNPSNTNQLFSCIKDSGIYSSTNGGINWAKLTAGGIPTINVGRSDISICYSNPNIIYVGIARNDNDETLGAFKSTNMGVSWTNVTPNPTYLGTQGGYDNTISVSPANPNNVFAGGIQLYSSTNGGANWSSIGEPTVHVDHHAAHWTSDGSKFTTGNDGGVTSTTDMGVSWNSSINVFPITQYYGIDVGIPDKNVFYGAAQDNGISITTNQGISWTHVHGGDGHGVAIDPLNINHVFVTIDYICERSTNRGNNWISINNGIVSSNAELPKMRTDIASPFNIYTNAAEFVYRSSNNGANWEKMNTTAFPGNVSNINVSRFSATETVVYASLNPSGAAPYTGKQLRVYTGGVWSERSTGIDSNVKVWGVRPHPTDSAIAYAYMSGFSAGKKVYKTTNKGITWVNISGNLPNVPIADVIPHPTDLNILYMGCEFGCYKTINGGVNWSKWNSGMPIANIITEFVPIDSIAQNGRYYIAAGTFGRSMWIREISGEDPVIIKNNNSSLPVNYSLSQNYPNPFNPSTKISFDLPVSGFVTLKVYDITGKEIAQLVNSDLNAGTYKINFNSVSLSSGIYFYRISAGSFTDTKKMVFVK